MVRFGLRLRGQYRIALDFTACGGEAARERRDSSGQSVMYVYDSYDHQFITERIAQYRGQLGRYLLGELSEEEFLPLRLQNGIYIQRVAPMMRIAIPYGQLSAKQLRALADIARRFDKGYIHVTTRQNVQLNWPRLEDTADILAALAAVEMHAIQTSGNCVRNTTTDQYAGVAMDEVEDPRPWCKIIRQWSTGHPEFMFLPRKFKIAVCRSEEDRAAFLFHDIGLQLVHRRDEVRGFKIFVGGGLGRTPMIGVCIRNFLPQQHLLTYLDAILRAYNRYGNRQNRYKARIKILVKAWTPAVFAQRVEEEWAHLKNGSTTLTVEEIERMMAFFNGSDYQIIDDVTEMEQLREIADGDRAFSRRLARNVVHQKQPGYAAVALSLKPAGVAPGDLTDVQLNAIADLSDTFAQGEIRTTHNQNMVIVDVLKFKLYAFWQTAKRFGLATPNIGTLTDIIC